MAVWRRGKADALLHHSDQGSQYTSEQCQRLLLENGIICSMSRAGNVWDNSAMESFFSSLKAERTAPKVYRTRDAARADVFDYIERFCNLRRRHSKLGYLSPMAFEARAMQTLRSVHRTGSRPISGVPVARRRASLICLHISTGPLYVLVNEWLFGYGLRGGRTGSRWRGRPLQDLRSWHPVARRGAWGEARGQGRNWSPGAAE